MNTIATRIKIAAIVVGLAFASQPARADQNSWSDMTILNLAKSRPSPDIQNIWGAAISASNKDFEQKVGKKIDSPTGNSLIYIAEKSFKSNGVVITATVFEGNKPACEGGANSFASEQSWADCPARVTLTDPSAKTTTLNTKACFNSYDMGGDLGIPPGDKTQVRYDENEKRVYFRVLSKGKNVPECEKSIKLPL